MSLNGSNALFQTKVIECSSEEQKKRRMLV